MAQLWRSCCVLFALLQAVSSGSKQNSCLRSFSTSSGLSLLRQSFQDGAELLNSTFVQNSQECLRQCCRIPECHLALWTQASDQGKHACLLVNCLSHNEPVCTFTPKEGSQASTRSPETHRNIQRQVNCLSPPKTGPCRASFPRWFYNSSSKTCNEFTYGGCVPNGNNYGSEQECWSYCNGVTEPASNSVPVARRRISSLKVRDSYDQLIKEPDQRQLDNERCTAPKKVGSCRAAFPRWYFDMESRSCREFVYGGCKGNKNNFVSEHQCLVACAGLKEDVPEPHKLQSETDDKEYCFAPAVTGRCRASFPRWFYNPASLLCEQFVYGGCGGNKNNYPSELECLTKCTGKTVPVDNQKDDEDRESNTQHQAGTPRNIPAISMVILLSICVLILLGGVIYFIVKLTKTEHTVSYQRAPHQDDKETLISTVQTL
ncbi:kunitz-type protease inhibitor 2 isoform X2 [Hemiscyllium ocellatum]|uniref:kunitz-type protease inhibitor 2 isoform X2 n=1 Tax=Hemiscyllium ocellatum TaxID=170820 RepID=UPI0029668660|nr:kunitz-type protease inhibitor 2 isoform X2 [Hemiscyllium ocellatum]